MPAVAALQPLATSIRHPPTLLMLPSAPFHASLIDTYESAP
jgi:hypothetical protein